MNALMIVDMQKCFINSNNQYLVKNIENHVINNNYDFYYYTKCLNTDSSPFSSILGWNGGKTLEEQKLVLPKTFAEKRFKIIKKFGYSISDNAIKELKKNKISKVYLVGTDVDACILSIGFKLFDNNIEPIFIKDLCGTSSSNQKLIEYTFEIIKRQFGLKSIKTNS